MVGGRVRMKTSLTFYGGIDEIGGNKVLLKDELIQIDEPPTHDSARFWAEKFYRIGDQQEGHALDKEFLREYLRRSGFTGEGKAPTLPPLVVEEISKRCMGAYEVLTGKGKIENLSLKDVNQLISELKKHIR
jgi:hypothetical protein